MSERKGGIPEKETICWDCQNYARCSWADGIPVKGWKATPTIIENGCDDNGAIRTVRSYLVEDCPHFCRDKKVRVRVREIAAIIGISERHTHRVLASMGVGGLEDLLKGKGYKLHVIRDLPSKNGTRRRTYFVEKI